ncbi:MAG: helix-turn-helix domain-containing protein [Planctomycetota bacterium]
MSATQLKQEESAWKALSDPTRRGILDALREGPMPTGKLSERFPLSRFAIMKHLRILQEAGLSFVEARGRERWNYVNPAAIHSLYQRWIRPFEEEHIQRLHNLKQLAEGPQDETRAAMSQKEELGTTEIVLELTIDAPLQRVWTALVEETPSWWHKDFYTRSGAESFHIEPKLGGLMFEDWGDGQGQIWGRVNGIGAPNYLQVIGDSSREWGGPNRGFMTWKLEEGEKGTTVRFEHSLFGKTSKQTQDSLSEGWQLLFGKCLKQYAETGETPDFDAMQGS